jgi:hypothetical protein
LRDDPLEVADVVFDEVASLRIPARVTVSPHVDGEHAISRGEPCGDVVERPSHAVEAVDHDQRLLSLATPINVVEAKTIHLEETVCGWRN